MKVNCDLGESFGAWKMGVDEAVMPNIDMANIACGFHAGDPNVMQRTLALAKMHQVTVGAHPGYHDLLGFGRRSIKHSNQEITNLIVYQVSALIGMAKVTGQEVTYVKPHGALYHDMMTDADVRFAIYQAVKDINLSQQCQLKLMIQATMDAKFHQQEAKAFGLDLMLEAFADRRYTDNGQLQSRNITGAVLNEQEIIEQVTLLTEQGHVITDSGKTLELQADSICVHGDNPAAVETIKKIKVICD